MRYAARRILDQAEADQAPGFVGKVNALEAPSGVGLRALPAIWTAEHVGKRLVEAFETLEKLPPLRGPRVPGNSWVPYLYDRGDLNSQQEVSEREKARRRREQNRIALRATAEELRRLDIVLEWLRELYAADPGPSGLCDVVQTWAKLRARGQSIKDWCREDSRSFQAFYRQRDKGLGFIAAGLGSAPVW